MSKVTTNVIAKVATVATGLAMAVSMAALPAHAAGLTSTQVQSILSLLSSFGADSATIANVNAALTGGTMTTTTTTSGGSCSFTRDLTVGSTGADVTALQTWLIGKGYSIPAGATGYFGAQTQAAVSAWQTAVGISPTAGYFGAKSRAAVGCSSSTTTTTTTGGGTGTGLKVSVASDSPNGTVLVTGQGTGDLGKFTFWNPTSAPIIVSSLSFNRIGVSNDASIDNIYLYNSDGTMSLTGSGSVNQGKFSFSNASGLFTVPANGSYEVSVLADIDKNNSSGQQIGVQLTNVGITSGALDSSVAFPISGGFQTVSSATTATAAFSTVSTSGGTISPGTGLLLWQDNVSISTNSVNLKSLTFTNIGSAPATSFANLILKVDGNAVGSTVASLNSNGTVTFTPATPFALATGSHSISLYGDIVGGSSLTFNFEIYQSGDAQLIDSQLNVPIRVTDGGTSNFIPLGGAAAITIAGVTSTSGVSVSKDPMSPSTNIPANVTHQLLGTFDFQTNGEPVKITDLFVTATLTGTDSNSASVTSLGLTNGQVFLNGVEVGPTHTITSGGTSTDFSMGSSMVIPANVVTPVQIYADTIDGNNYGLANGATVQVALTLGTSNGQGTSSRNVVNVPTATVSANTLTVSSAGLSAASFAGYGNQTIIPGTSNAKLGAFTLSTGSTEGVNVNTVTVTLSTNNAASVTNLVLKNDATGAVIGSAITTPQSGVNTFSGSFSVPVSSSVTIDVYGNILSSANSGSWQLTAVGASGNGAISFSPVSSTGAPSLQTITLGSGTLSVTQGAGDIVSGNVVAGSTGVTVGQFTFTGSNSSFTVQNLGVLVLNAGASAISSLQLQYTNSAGTVVTSTPVPVVTGSTYATATFSGLSAFVPNNSTSNVTVLANLAPISSSNASGNPINVLLDWGGTAGGDNTFRALDGSGNQKTTVGAANVASNGTLYTRETIPTYTMQNLGSVTPTTGSPLYQFSIAASSGGAVDWSKVSFNIATTNVTVSNLYLVNVANGAQNLLDSTNSATTTSTKITMDLTQNSQQPKHQQVAANTSTTYALYGTVSGWATGSSLTISLANGDALTGNGTATAKASGNNIVWSDESYPNTSGSAHTVGTGDWTDGFLLNNFTTDTTSYSH